MRWWPFGPRAPQREREAVAAAAPLEAARPRIEPPPIAWNGWAALAPIAPTIQRMSLLADPTAFEAGLASRAAPAFLGPLSHGLGAEGPFGMVVGFARPGQPSVATVGPGAVHVQRRAQAPRGAPVMDGAATDATASEPGDGAAELTDQPEPRSLVPLADLVVSTAHPPVVAHSRPPARPFVTAEPLGLPVARPAVVAQRQPMSEAPDALAEPDEAPRPFGDDERPPSAADPNGTAETLTGPREGLASVRAVRGPAPQNSTEAGAPLVGTLALARVASTEPLAGLAPTGPLAGLAPTGPLAGLAPTGPLASPEAPSPARPIGLGPPISVRVPAGRMVETDVAPPSPGPAADMVQRSAPAAATGSPHLGHADAGTAAAAPDQRDVGAVPEDEGPTVEPSDGTVAEAAGRLGAEASSPPGPLVHASELAAVQPVAEDPVVATVAGPLQSPEERGAAMEKSPLLGERAGPASIGHPHTVASTATAGAPLVVARSPGPAHGEAERAVRSHDEAVPGDAGPRSPVPLALPSPRPLQRVEDRAGPPPDEVAERKASPDSGGTGPAEVPATAPPSAQTAPLLGMRGFASALTAAGAAPAAAPPAPEAAAGAFPAPPSPATATSRAASPWSGALQRSAEMSPTNLGARHVAAPAAAIRWLPPVDPAERQSAPAPVRAAAPPDAAVPGGHAAGLASDGVLALQRLPAPAVPPLARHLPSAVAWSATSTRAGTGVGDEHAWAGAHEDAGMAGAGASIEVPTPPWADEDVALQRVTDGGSGPGTVASSAADRAGAASAAAAGAGAVSAAGGAPAGGGPNLDKLAHDLYPRLRARLRNDLRLDRERAGRVTDRIH